mmetsp:Transcript_12468/g.19626  ORF Transcript_12468/g.19626 Transcript_12468/m.19626 type:complete len:202 (+) Transcript_12468:2-607(+)
MMEKLELLQQELQVLRDREKEREQDVSKERELRLNTEAQLEQVVSERNALKDENDALKAELESLKERYMQQYKAEIEKYKAELEQYKNQDETLRERLRNGHASIHEALKTQEAQMAVLADVIPSLDMVHSSLLSSIAVDSTRLQSHDINAFQSMTLSQSVGGSSTGVPLASMAPPMASMAPSQRIMSDVSLASSASRQEYA